MVSAVPICSVPHFPTGAHAHCSPKWHRAELAGKIGDAEVQTSRTDSAYFGLLLKKKAHKGASLGISVATTVARVLPLSSYEAFHPSRRRHSFLFYEPAALTVLKFHLSVTTA